MPRVPRHPGYFEHPQNCDPAFVPRFAVLPTMGLPQLGHDGTADPVDHVVVARAFVIVGSRYGSPLLVSSIISCKPHPSINSIPVRIDSPIATQTTRLYPQSSTQRFDRVRTRRMRLTGTLVEWNDDRGFGFLEPSKGGERAFCHVSQFTVRTNRPVVGQRLSYETSRDERGRLRATKISPIALEPRSKKKPAPAAPASQLSPWIAVFGATIFLIVIVGLAIANRLPWIVPLIYVIASLLAIFAYAFDKSAAMNRRWRTQESTLHLFALVGGWPGAWIAQLAFRHKTRKTSFVLSFVFCVIVNLAVLTWIVVEREGPLAQMLWGIGSRT